MNERDDPLVDRLVADLQPTRPQRARTAALWLLAAVAATAVLVHLVAGMDPGTALRPGGTWFLLGELLLAGLGVECAVAVVGMASPQRVGRPAAAWAVLLVGLMPLATLVVLLAGGADAAGHDAGLGHWQCAAWGTLSGVAVAAVLVAWLRRGAPASPARAGLYAGLAAGAIGSATYGLACPYTGLIHWGIWHFVPVAAGALAGRLLLPALLRW